MSTRLMWLDFCSSLEGLVIFVMRSVLLFKPACKLLLVLFVEELASFSCFFIRNSVITKGMGRESEFTDGEHLRTERCGRS